MAALASLTLCQPRVDKDVGLGNRQVRHHCSFEHSRGMHLQLGARLILTRRARGRSSQRTCQDRHALFANAPWEARAGRRAALLPCPCVSRPAHNRRVGVVPDRPVHLEAAPQGIVPAGVRAGVGLAGCAAQGVYPTRAEGGPAAVHGVPGQVVGAADQRQGDARRGPPGRRGSQGRRGARRRGR